MATPGRPAGPHLTHLFMEVGDLARARWFWIEAVGLEVNEDRGMYLQVGGNGGFAIGMEQAPDAALATTSAGLEIVIRVPDVDATAERMTALGIEIIDGPVDTPWGSRNCWLTDPDGRIVSLYSSALPIVGRRDVQP